jgi:hypothetical protein
MGTRSLIKVENKKYKEESTVYKHWDGYPENMIPLLSRFMDENGRGDVEYATANLILFLKLDEFFSNRERQLNRLDKHGKDYYALDMEYIAELSAETIFNTTQTGCGVVNVQKGWPDYGQEYEYRIDLANNKLFYRAQGNKTWKKAYDKNKKVA